MTKSLLPLGLARSDVREVCGWLDLERASLDVQIVDALELDQAEGHPFLSMMSTEWVDVI
jgi:hypothetical protein